MRHLGFSTQRAATGATNQRILTRPYDERSEHISRGSDSDTSRRHRRDSLDPPRFPRQLDPFGMGSIRRTANQELRHSLE